MVTVNIAGYNLLVALNHVQVLTDPIERHVARHHEACLLHHRLRVMDGIADWQHPDHRVVGIVQRLVAGIERQTADRRLVFGCQTVENVMPIRHCSKLVVHDEGKDWRQPNHFACPIITSHLEVVTAQTVKAAFGVHAVVRAMIIILFALVNIFTRTVIAG